MQFELLNDLQLKQTTGRDMAERTRRDTMELLLGASAILLFAVALAVWPRLGYFISDVVDAVRDLI
jgi:hypothetical protein